MKGDSIIYLRISSYNLGVEYFKYLMILQEIVSFQFVWYRNTSFRICYICKGILFQVSNHWICYSRNEHYFT